MREVLSFRWATAEKHLLFFQGTDGYELVEREGPPPSPGTKSASRSSRASRREPFRASCPARTSSTDVVSSSALRCWRECRCSFEPAQSCG